VVGTAIAPTPVSETTPASLAVPRQEPQTLAIPAPGYAPDGPALLRPPAHAETSFAAAEALGINAPDIQRAARTEEFLWLQSPPVLPSSISLANSFRIHVSGTAKIAMTLPAIPVTAFTSRGTLAQQPVLSTWAIGTPVSDCTPPARALWQALPFLEPRGVGPASRTLVSGLQELPKRSRRVPEFRLEARTGSVRSVHPPGTWEFAARLGHVHPLPMAWVSSTEDIHPMEVRVQAPGLTARPEPLLSNGPLATIPLGVHDQPRERSGALGLTGIQRFRAAALIRIREPELRNLAPSDLPVPSTSLQWPCVRMVSKFPLGATPVPLRPPLGNPRVC
jgi:hypothetical protein